MGKKIKKVGSYHTLLSGILNTHLGKVMMIEEGKEGKFLIQVFFFCLQ